MKIRITSRNVMTQSGVFHDGNELSSDDYPEALLRHLVEGAGAAEYIENKMVEAVIENKAEPKVPAKKKPRKKKKKPSASSQAGQA